MPITSKYSDQLIETMLTEVAAVFDKHQASPDLVMMIAGNLVTHVLNQDVAASHRTLLAEKFAQSLLSSIQK